jgi:hypothetical protein
MSSFYQNRNVRFLFYLNDLRKGLFRQLVLKIDFARGPRIDFLQITDIMVSP